MTKETAKEIKKLDLNAIIEQARGTFSKNEKSLAMQMTTGSSLTKNRDDEDYVIYDKGDHWLKLTGLKGLVFGKVHEISGRNNSGKSTHALAFMAAAQRQDIQVILLDSENKFDANRFEKYFNGKCEDLLVVTSRVGIEGADQINALVNAINDTDPSKRILIVWDSVAATLDSGQEKHDLRESRALGIASKEYGAILRSWISLMEKVKDKKNNREKLAVLLINQVYANIGSVGYVEAGGEKIAYHSSLIVQLSRKGDCVRQKDKVYIREGIIAKASCKKNHLFSGEHCVAQLELKITAGDIQIAQKIKKSDSEDTWEIDPEEESAE